MDLGSMIQREDFFNLLAKTICRYYKEVHNQDIFFEYKKKPDTTPIVINKTLSFISGTPIGKGLYEFLNSEYNVRSSYLKWIIGKIAVITISVFPSIGKVRTAYISNGVLGKNEFINPQNRSIRIFNYDRLIVDCIIKDGFTDKYFKNQIEFRKQYSYNFMLPLITYGNNWFREPLLKGNPLARVTNLFDYKKGLSDAFSAIWVLVKDTLQFIDSETYCNHLINQINCLLKESLIKKHILYSIDLHRIVSESASVIVNSPITVPTSMSHGDLQSGNIWVDRNKKTWIYDWETAGRRSVWYDASVLGYSLRRPIGWKHLFQSSDFSIMLRFDDRKDYSIEEINSIKRIILLEDMSFYLEDMLELPKDWGSNIFDRFCERILPLF